MFGGGCDSTGARRFRPTKREEKDRVAKRSKLGVASFAFDSQSRRFLGFSFLAGHSSSPPSLRRIARAAALAECLKSASRPVEITGGRKSMGVGRTDYVGAPDRAGTGAAPTP